MATFYVDTCIWRDYWENRTDKLRPLGEFASNFFNKAVENHDIIIVSDLIIRELHVSYNYLIIEEILSIVPEELLYRISFSEDQLSRAKILSIHAQIPTNDALHIMMAKDNNSILISRDVHMIDFGDAIKPEEL